MAITGGGSPSPNMTLLYPGVSRGEDTNGKWREYRWKCPSTFTEESAPELGDECPDDENMICRNVTITPINYEWDIVTARYSDISWTLGMSPGDPGSFYVETEIIEGLNVSDEGEEYREPHQVFTYTKIVSSWDTGEQLIFAGIAGKSNSQTSCPAFTGQTVGTILCLGTRAFWQQPDTGSGGRLYRVTYFEAKPDGFNTTKYPGASFTSILNRG